MRSEGQPLKQVRSEFVLGPPWQNHRAEARTHTPTERRMYGRPPRLAWVPSTACAQIAARKSFYYNSEVE